MRRAKMAIICFALAASVLAGTSVASAGQEASTGEDAAAAGGCHALVICIYTNTNYVNPYYDADCVLAAGQVVNLMGTRRSAMNRCASRSNNLYLNGTFVACMNHGGDRPNPGAFNQVYVFNQGGAVC